MGVLDNIEPRKVFGFFEQIASIPHGSTDTKKISDYCVGFAKERGLACRQDESNNIIIWKDGSAGYEDCAPVILQGHLDMVCEKNEGVDIDFEKDGLRLILDGDTITADGTTLGGDDGIAIAYCLAILDSDDIEHPPLECVFTVDEEIGMLGAAALDVSDLKSKILINIDSEDEGHLLVSCAGGVTTTVHIPVTKTEIPSGYELVYISVEGLVGGHSGVEIDKGRANANKLLGRLLYEIKREMEVYIVSVNGGSKDNAIPRSAEAFIAVPNKSRVEDIVSSYGIILNKEYRNTDPEMTVISSDVDEGEKSDIVFDRSSTDRVISALVALPNGIIKMCYEPQGLVQTSLNMGILRTSDTEVSASYAVRSSVETEKDALVATLECIADSLGGTIDNTGAYPAWEYRDESPLRDIFLGAYREQYGSEMSVDAIHAGVECGLFAGQIEGLDAISFGPDMRDIHTPAESMSIASVERTWKLLLMVLKRLGKH